MAKTTTRPKGRAAARGAKGRSGATASRRARGGARGGSRRAAPATSHRSDLVGLALLALGAFLACVEYLDWDGGVVGVKLSGGLHLLVGRAAALVPPLAVGLGAAVFVGSPLARLRPLRTGLVLIAASVVLGLGDPDATRAESHGGVIGAHARSGLEALVGQVGVQILVALGALAGAVLVTGASIGLIVRSSGRRVARAAGSAAVQARRGGERLGDEVARRYRRPASRPTLAAVPSPPPAAGPLDGSREYSDIFGAVPAFEHPAEPTSPPAGGPAPAVTDERLEPDGVPAEEQEATTGEPVTDELTERTVIGDDEPTLRPLAPPVRRYALPAASILQRGAPVAARPQDHERVGRQLTETLAHFHIEARVVGMVSGPRVTRYELQLAPGIKVNRVAQLRDDLAYALATTEIRILAPIPGKQAVGVEVPNTAKVLVRLGDIFGEPPAGSSPLTAWLGVDISGQGVACDLARMPHLLIAGTTGSGKSGCINALLCSILLRATPDEVRMILVDPKKVELNHYESIPHLLTPVVTNMKNAALVLQNVVREMESRYEIMEAAKARNLAELNRIRVERGRDRLPYVLVVIDELADLMMVSPAEVEDAVIRLAQKSRAVGIHLVLATQSPRVDVITGMIKANVPSRIAFAVSSQTDSRVILDVNGAEALLGQGDMLYKPLGTPKLHRVQGAYISEEETRAIVAACRRQAEPEFEEELLELPSDVEPEQLAADEDPVLEDAIRLVAQHQTASVSLLQRRLRVGYTRAGRLIDMLERRGVVSGYEGSKARKVLITEGDLARVLGGAPAAAAPEERTGTHE
jgi:S-DNA-T family DNA segregation ATPase FtsK/SpoIIIE